MVNINRIAAANNVVKTAHILNKCYTSIPLRPDHDKRKPTLDNAFHSQLPLKEFGIDLSVKYHLNVKKRTMRNSEVGFYCILKRSGKNPGNKKGLS